MRTNLRVVAEAGHGQNVVSQPEIEPDVDVAPLLDSREVRGIRQLQCNGRRAPMGFDAMRVILNGWGCTRRGLDAGDWALVVLTVVLFAGISAADSAEDAADSGFPTEQGESRDQSEGPSSVEPSGAQMPSPATQAELEEAVRKAEEAADQAWAAARAADQRARDAERKHEQSGPYLGAAFAYAVEDFDDSIIVQSSVAGAAFVGYRFHRWFSADLRYEGFNGFDLKSSRGRGKIDGYAITINGKMRPFEGPIQPVIGIGMGGIRLDTEFDFNGGARLDSSDSEFVFRMSGGIDLPVNDHLMLNFEAAYLIPDEDLSDLEIGMLSAGLTYVF